MCDLAGGGHEGSRRRRRRRHCVVPSDWRSLDIDAAGRALEHESVRKNYQSPVNTRLNGHNDFLPSLAVVHPADITRRAGSRSRARCPQTASPQSGTDLTTPTHTQPATHPAPSESVCTLPQLLAAKLSQVCHVSASAGEKLQQHRFVNDCASYGPVGCTAPATP